MRRSLVVRLGLRRRPTAGGEGVVYGDRNTHDGIPEVFVG